MRKKQLASVEVLPSNQSILVSHSDREQVWIHVAPLGANQEAAYLIMAQ